MSSRKFVPYENKRDNVGRKNHSEMQLSERPSSSSIQRRDIHPQFSEPEEYGFRVPNSFTFQQSVTHQKRQNFNLNKSWNNIQPLVTDYRENVMTALPLHQPLPTFRQYMNEENSDNEDGFSNAPPKPIIINRINKSAFVVKGNEKAPINSNNSKQKPEKTQKGFVGTRVRHMTGTVDQIIRWHKMAKGSELEIHFEVAGTIESTINKEGMQLLLIRSDSGHVLQGVFYTIDRALPNFRPGTLITSSGNMIGSNKMHVFDANVITRDDFMAVQRLAFLSQRALEESLLP